jgi:hypothetical protein
MGPRALVGGLALLAVLAVPPGTDAQVRTVSFTTLLGEYTVVFDAARLPEEDLRALIMLSPHLHGWSSLALAPRLERCLVDDPAYRDCGTRTPTAPHFQWNARLNLDRGAEALRALERLRYPRELEAVVAYSRRSLTFSLWLEATKFAYLETGDAAVLARGYDGLEPARLCGSALEEIGRASDVETRYHLVTYKWHNCLNDAFRGRLGPYPRDAWERFLTAHAIREEVLDSLGEAMRPRRN